MSTKGFTIRSTIEVTIEASFEVRRLRLVRSIITIEALFEVRIEKTIKEKICKLKKLAIVRSNPMVECTFLNCSTLYVVVNKLGFFIT